MISLLVMIIAIIVLVILVGIFFLIGGISLLPVLLVAADVLICVGIIKVIVDHICQKKKEKKEEL